MEYFMNGRPVEVFMFNVSFSQSKSPELGTFCGSKIPSLVRSSGNSLYITLTSDDADTGKGFQAVWRAVSNNIRKY